MSRKKRRVPAFRQEEDTDPLSVVVNLFDVAMVFADGRNGNEYEYAGVFLW